LIDLAEIRSTPLMANSKIVYIVTKDVIITKHLYKCGISRSSELYIQRTRTEHILSQ